MVNRCMRGALAPLLFLTAVSSTAPSARSETQVRVAMTASEIPDWVGQPDQGSEGSRFVGFSLYDGLINWDLSRSDIEAPLKPALATGWHVDPSNNERWIFDLRRGVKFHDGCAWDADSAVWNLNRVLDPKANGFTPLLYARARTKVLSVVAVEKTGDFQIAITTKGPDSIFPYEIVGFFMMSRCAFDKAGGDWDKFGKSPQGTGPYKFDSVVPHERLMLVKNHDYWDHDRIPKHDRLVLLPMPEATSRAAALLSGQVDFIEAPSPDILDQLKRAGMQVVTNSYPHNWDYVLNFMQGPFKDVRVRRAANYAINRDEFVDMLSGTAIPGYGLFTPNSRFYGNPHLYEYNPDKAKALLKEAGCLPCAITIAISPSGSGQMQPIPMNELAKAQLEAVGFKVSFQVMDWNVLLDVNRNGWEKSPTLSGLNNSLTSPDPGTGVLRSAMTRFRPPNGSNWGWYKNDEVDRLGEEILATFDEEKMAALVRKVHEIVVDDALRVFIVDDLNPRALSPKLKGFVQAQSWLQDMTPIQVIP